MMKEEESPVVECMNSYFLNVTDILGLDQFFTDMDQMDQRVNPAIEKYKNHESTW